MSDATAWAPPDLTAFAAHLRTAGFRIGAGEVLRCTALLERLRRLGRSPADRDELAEWLSPLLCSSAQEQNAFGRLLQSFERQTGQFVEPPPPPPPPPPRPAARGPLPRSLKLALAGLAVLMVVALLSVPLPLQRDNPTPPGGTPGTVVPSPKPDTDRPSGPRFVTYGVLGRVLLCGAPLLAWLALRRARRARDSALARAAGDAPDAARLSPWDHGLRLFDLDSARQVEARAGPSTRARERLRTLSNGLRYAMEGLRVRRQVIARRIDARASAHASARHAGLPRWVWRRRSAKADYPLLIDTRSGRDHLLVLGRAFSARMQRAGIEHTRYLFGSDPRALREDRPNARFHSLETIGSSFHHATLIVIGTGDFLEDATSLREGPRGSLAGVLAQWQRVVLLTPLPRHQWTWRERRIEGLGVIVLPLTPEDLRTLGDRLRVAPGAAPPRRPQRMATPSALSNDEAWAIKWHSDTPPGEDDREALLDAVALALPPIGLEWLGVLALFPELRPELTLHVATTLREDDGAMAVDEADYAALCALPWLRAGRMPDWLRLEFVRLLSPQALARAHRVLDEWLVRAAGDTSATEAAIPLKIALAERERMKEQIVRDPESPYRDVIFLRFLEGGEMHTLDLKAPVELFDRVAREMVLRERRNGVAAIAAAVALLAGSLLLASVFERLLVTPTRAFLLTGALMVAATIRGFAGAAADRWQKIAAGLAVAAAAVLGSFVLAARFGDTHDGAMDFFLCALVLPAIALAFRPARPRLPLASIDPLRREASDVGGATLCLLAALALKAFAVMTPNDEMQGAAWLGFGSLFAFGQAWVYAERFALPLRIVALHAVGATLLLLAPLAIFLLQLGGADISTVGGLIAPSWYLVVPLAANAGCIAAVGAGRETTWRWPLAINLLAIAAVSAAILAMTETPHSAAGDALDNETAWMAGLAVLAAISMIAGLGLDKPGRLASRAATHAPMLVLVALGVALAWLSPPKVLWMAVPWLAVPVTLTWWTFLDNRGTTWRDRLSLLAPPPAFAWLAGMWLSALGNTLLARTAGTPDIRSHSIAVLAVPLTVAFARACGPVRWPLLCLGLLPLCVPLPLTLGSLNFGIALSCVAIYALMTSAAARELLRGLSASTWQRLLPPMLILGFEFQVRYGVATTGLIDAALLLVVLCGALRVQAVVAVPTILAVAAVEGLAQWWRVDGVMVYDCLTPLAGILLYRYVRRLGELSWRRPFVSPDPTGAAPGALRLGLECGVVIAAAIVENMIALRMSGVRGGNIVDQEVWGPDAATWLGFLSFALGLCVERFVSRRRDLVPKESVTTVAISRAWPRPMIALFFAAIPLAFVVAAATSNQVAGWAVAMVLVPALFVPLGRSATRWMAHDGADLLQSLQAPPPGSRGWRAWIPTPGVLAPAFLIAASLLHSTLAMRALGPSLAATLARGAGAFSLAYTVVAVARLSGAGARLGRWRDPALSAVAVGVLVASWWAQPLARLYPARPQPSADETPAPTPAAPPPTAASVAAPYATNAPPASSPVPASAVPRTVRASAVPQPGAGLALIGQRVRAMEQARRDAASPSASTSAPASAAAQVQPQAQAQLNGQAPEPMLHQATHASESLPPINPAAQYAEPPQPGLHELRTGPLASGLAGTWGNATTICTSIPPPGWTIRDVTINLEGGRTCDRTTRCEVAPRAGGQVCATFALQGRDDSTPTAEPATGTLRFRLDDGRSERASKKQ